MNPTKIYPANEPHHKIATGTKAQTFNGYVRALLTTENISSIQWALEQLTLIEGHDDIIDLVSEVVGAALDEGKEKMNAFHGFLGAYDVDDNFQLTKPDSELKKHHPSVPNVRSLMAALAKDNKGGAA